MNIDRMRRHQERTMPTTISQPRDDAWLDQNPYLTRWAREMARRFGRWTVTMHDHGDYVTFAATADPTP